MSRYIEYDAINYRNDKMHDKSSDFIDGVIYMAQRIEEAPSIDIVRCKECLHSYEWDSGCGAELVCKARRCDPADWGSRVEFYVKADDFCSRGERREP